jgi:hypothetical protein
MIRVTRPQPFKKAANGHHLTNTHSMDPDVPARGQSPDVIRIKMTKTLPESSMPFAPQEHDRQVKKKTQNI